jgi:hypothetical protein
MADDDLFVTRTRASLELMPDVGALHIADDEAYAREARTRVVEMLTMDVPKRADQIPATMPGTLTLFLARRGSSLLDEVRGVARADRNSARRLSDRLRRQFAERKRVPLSEAVQQLVSQRVFAELRFGDRTVARNLFVPDDESVCVVTLPYTGAELVPDAFRLIEYSMSGADQSLDAVILKYDPPISAAERAALAAADPSLPNGGPVSGPCDADLVEAVVMVLLYALLLKPGDFTADQHVAEERIREIGPNATARELMQIRREAIKFR